VRRQRHAPAAPYPRERQGTHCTGGWVGLRAGLDRCGKSRPTGIRSSERPARWWSLYRLRYPAHYLLTYLLTYILTYLLTYSLQTNVLSLCGSNISPVQTKPIRTNIHKRDNTKHSKHKYTYYQNTQTVAKTAHIQQPTHYQTS